MENVSVTKIYSLTSYADKYKVSRTAVDNWVKKIDKKGKGYNKICGNFRYLEINGLKIIIEG